MRDTSFSLTLTSGWCLAILVLFYLGLADVLLSRRDPVLAALGLGVAGLNFAIGYPIAQLPYRSILTPLLKRFGQK
jgi:nitrate/nitrite transporter NarK